MEHIVVAIRPGQGPGALAWAIEHARATPAALEIIASGLESRDPRALLLAAGSQLRAANSTIPCAMRPVTNSLARPARPGAHGGGPDAHRPDLVHPECGQGTFGPGRSSRSRTRWVHDRT